MSIFGSIGGGLKSYWNAGKSFAGKIGIPMLAGGAAGYASGGPWGAAGGALGALGGMDQNAASAKAARDMMEFQERMSSTAYQRAMKDMRLAGLNPILAGTVGGASTPSGAMPNVVNVADSAARGVSTAVQAKTALANSQADVALKGAQTQQSGSQTALNHSTTLLQSRQSDRLMWDTENAALENKRLYHLIDQAESQAWSAKYQSEVDGVRSKLEKDRLNFIRENPKIWKSQAINEGVQPWINSAKGIADTINPFKVKLNYRRPNYGSNP